MPSKARKVILARKDHLGQSVLVKEKKEAQKGPHEETIPNKLFYS